LKAAITRGWGPEVSADGRGLALLVAARGAELPGNEIPLPGLDRVESAAAVPLVVHGELVGPLYLEAERQGQFGPGDERLLRVLGGHLAAALALLQSDRRESPIPPPDQPSPPAGARRSWSRTTSRRQCLRRRQLGNS
jgi:GAF domain-containing protein